MHGVHPKKRIPPMKEITIPKKLAPLVKAFSAEDQSARLLINEAAKAISKAEPSSSFKLSFEEETLPEEELEGVIALMRDLAPQDAIETIYAAQIVSSHIMGLRLLSHDFPADQALGLKLLRFSNEAMGQLIKKRAGGSSQHINITYNYAGSGPVLMQTIMPEEDPCQ